MGWVWPPLLARALAQRQLQAVAVVVWEVVALLGAAGQQDMAKHLLHRLQVMALAVVALRATMMTPNASL
jgi:hypothetical protein